jgi:hypothetical protein
MRESETGARVQILQDDNLLELYYSLCYLAQEDFSNGRFNERIEERDEELDQPRINPIESNNAA